jgi:hypothetical protein
MEADRASWHLNPDRLYFFELAARQRILTRAGKDVDVLEQAEPVVHR